MFGWDDGEQPGGALCVGTHQNRTANEINAILLAVLFAYSDVFLKLRIFTLMCTDVITLE